MADGLAPVLMVQGTQWSHITELQQDSISFRSRRSLRLALAATRGFTWLSGATPALDPFDALADVLETSVHLDGLRASSLLPLLTR